MFESEESTSIGGVVGTRVTRTGVSNGRGEPSYYWKQSARTDTVYNPLKPFSLTNHLLFSRIFEMTPLSKFNYKVVIQGVFLYFQYRKENRKVLAENVFMTGSSEHLTYNDLFSFCLTHLIFPVLEIFSNRPINGKVKEPHGGEEWNHQFIHWSSPIPSFFPGTPSLDEKNQESLTYPPS